MTRFAPIERGLSRIADRFQGMGDRRSAHEERMLSLGLAGRRLDMDRERLGMAQEKFGLEKRSLLPQIQQGEAQQEQRLQREEEGKQLSGLNDPNRWKEFVGLDQHGTTSEILAGIVEERKEKPILVNEEADIMAQVLAKSKPIDLVELSRTLRMNEAMLIERGAGTGENPQLDQHLQSIKERMVNVNNGLQEFQESPGAYAMWKLSRLSEKFGDEAFGMLNPADQNAIKQLKQEASLEREKQKAEIRKIDRSEKGESKGLTKSQQVNLNQAAEKIVAQEEIDNPVDVDPAFIKKALKPLRKRGMGKSEATAKIVSEKQNLQNNLARETYKTQVNPDYTSPKNVMVGSGFDKNGRLLYWNMNQDVYTDPKGRRLYRPKKKTVGEKGGETDSLRGIAPQVKAKPNPPLRGFLPQVEAVGRGLRGAMDYLNRPGEMEDLPRYSQRSVGR